MSSVSTQPGPAEHQRAPGTSAILAELAPSFARLRTAVRAALATRPRASQGARICAREFGFDKSIGWKIFQIGFGTDPHGAFPAVPGARGWEIVIAKFRAAGVSDSVLRDISESLSAFEARLAERRIDRSMLASMAAAVEGGEERARQMERVRKQASDSQAVILGVQSSARIGCYVVAPSANQGMADVAALTVADGLERRRPGSPWPLYTPIGLTDPNGQRTPRRAVPLESARTAPVVGDCSSAEISEAEIASTEQGAFVFHARDSRRQGPLRVAFAEVVVEAGPIEKRGAEKVCEFTLPITMPTEVAVLDVLVHRSVSRTGAVQADLRATGACDRGIARSKDLPVLPLDQGPSEVLDLEVAEASPGANESYRELRERAAAKLGHTLADFACHRVVLAYPPVPCLLTIWWELAASI